MVQSGSRQAGRREQSEMMLQMHWCAAALAWDTFQMPSAVAGPAGAALPGPMHVPYAAQVRLGACVPERGAVQ